MSTVYTLLLIFYTLLLIFFKKKVVKRVNISYVKYGKRVKYGIHPILTKLGMVVALDLSSNHVQYYAVDFYRSRAMRVQSSDLDSENFGS